MNPSKIPLELRASSRWVNWKRHPLKGKMILDAKTDEGAKEWPRNPDVWVSFPAALKSAQWRHRGVGLVIETPFIGVDFDHCIEDGVLNPKIEALIKKMLATYTEVSPSGTGLHMWYKCAEHAKLPNQATGLFEVYARGRYLTVTGNRVEGSPDSVTPISLSQALELFHLADPSALEDADLYKNIDGEEGYWSSDALFACLESWKRFNREFQYVPIGNKYAVPCPGNTCGWPEGEHHSFKDPTLSKQTMVWLINGWPVFSCFHAHCQGKTWKDIAAYYDPDRIFFNVDEWIEEQIAVAEANDNG